MNDMQYILLLVIVEGFQVIAFAMVLKRAIMRSVGDIIDRALSQLDAARLIKPFYEEGAEGDERRKILQDFVRRCGAEAMQGALGSMKTGQNPGGGAAMLPGAMPDLSSIPGLPSWLGSLIQFAPVLGQFAGARQGGGGGTQQKGGGQGDWH